jgi:protein dithiol oxidoreductase (disulfide-forming)
MHLLDKERVMMKAAGLIIAALCLLAPDRPLASPSSNRGTKAPRNPTPEVNAAIQACDREGWQAGIHYIVLNPPQDPTTPSGKVELVELFLYSAPMSRHMQPRLQAWLAEHASVQHVRKPAVAFRHALFQAQLYLTLKELRRLDLHDAAFLWIADAAHFKTYHQIEKPDAAAIGRLNLEFATTNGIDAKRFKEVYDSPKIAHQVFVAELETHGYKVNGTPTFAINGRFSTSVARLAYPRDRAEPEDFTETLRLVDCLARADKPNS